MDFRVRLQLAEAFGPENRWFCSEAHGRTINDRDLLLAYYIINGGAEDFAQRYAQAMGKLNRWYCSEFYQSDIRDPEILWEYFVNHAFPSCQENDYQFEVDSDLAELTRI
jgi:hypothetical protein